MKTRTELIEEFLTTIDVEHLDLPYCVDASEVNSFDEILDAIDDSNGFEVDIIFYANAMEYLTRNDPSLNESMEIAEELGYTPKNINSELLASLLASRNCRDEFYEYKSEIDTFFDEL
jgi:nitric oxide synthase oxygenase domain/subunit